MYRPNRPLERLSRQRFEAGVKAAEPEVWIELHPKPDRVPICDGCGEPVPHVHDTTERWVRDLPIFEARTRLLVHRCRLACPRCGPTIERLPWLERYARVTTRLAESVARLCMVLPQSRSMLSVNNLAKCPKAAAAG